MFTPKYAQPFTLAEALNLDPSVITEEITRLQNSLTHLRTSNTTLLQYLSEEEEDQDLRESVQENELTIASQEERIDMLRAALASKIGVRADNSHYAPLPSLGPSASITIPSSRPPPATRSTPSPTPPPHPTTPTAVPPPPPPASPPGLPRPSSLGPPPGLPPLSSTTTNAWTPGGGNGSIAVAEGAEDDDGVYL